MKIASMNDNLDENTNNQGLSGDSETGTNDNIDGRYICPERQQQLE